VVANRSAGAGSRDSVTSAGFFRSAIAPYHRSGRQRSVKEQPKRSVRLERSQHSAATSGICHPDTGDDCVTDREGDELQESEEDGVPSQSEARMSLLQALAAGGFVAPDGEADELLRASGEGTGTIEELLARRLRGEPLAWIVGSVRFCGLRVHVETGVFVPRPHTEALAERAVSLLPDAGIAVDLCTGCGAIPVVLASARPRATVLATDLDPLAVTCASGNGVHALVGDLDEPLPPSLRGRVDLITAVVPYVPTEELHLLPRDVLANEPHSALDGGRRGTALLVAAAQAGARWLRPGGSLLLEVGGDQAGEVMMTLRELGLSEIRVHRDEDGQDRSIEALHPPRRGSRKVAGRFTKVPRTGPTSQLAALLDSASANLEREEKNTT
jgi:release factor glutamine methyltransferase